MVHASGHARGMVTLMRVYFVGLVLLGTLISLAPSGTAEDPCFEGSGVHEGLGNLRACQGTYEACDGQWVDGSYQYTLISAAVVHARAETGNECAHQTHEKRHMEVCFSVPFSGNCVAYEEKTRPGDEQCALTASLYVPFVLGPYRADAECPYEPFTVPRTLPWDQLVPNP